MYIHTPQIFGDNRGEFAEWFKASALRAATGRDFTLAQANVSTSKRGVIRGMHFGYGQAKYVTCAHGAILDVAVNLDTLEIHMVRLAAEEHTAFFIPEGYAHGFLALQDSTVIYLTSTEYDPQREFGFSPFDAQVGIEWPSLGDVPSTAGQEGYILSDKDAQAPSWAEVAAMIDRSQLR